MVTVGVFLGSSNGSSAIYGEVARILGQEITRRGFNLACGAGGSGLMGILMNTVIDNGGNAVGVMSHDVSAAEIPNARLQSIIHVETLQDRKKKILDMSDVLLILPGGVGTLDEFFQVFSLKKLGLHQKPIGLLNIDHFYDAIISQIDNLVDKKFAKQKHQELVLVDVEPIRMLDRLLTS